MATVNHIDEMMEELNPSVQFRGTVCSLGCGTCQYRLIDMWTTIRITIENSGTECQKSN